MAISGHRVVDQALVSWLFPTDTPLKTRPVDLCLHAFVDFAEEMVRRAVAG